MPESASEFLSHYGVAGMKWGKRTSRGGSKPSSRGKKNSVPASKFDGSPDFKESRLLRAQPQHTLSNAQLKKVNERLQLEKSYAELTTPKLKDKKGLKKVNDILDAVGAAQKIYAIGNSPMVKDVRSEMDKNLSKKRGAFADTRGLPRGR